jgi:hypothetical protein
MTPIERMLAGFPQNPSDDYVTTLFDAAKEFTPEIIEAACSSFVSGKADGFDPRFPPSVAQWSKEARRLDEIKRAKEAYEAAKGKTNVVSEPISDTWFLRKYKAMKEGSK